MGHTLKELGIKTVGEDFRTADFSQKLRTLDTCKLTRLEFAGRLHHPREYRGHEDNGEADNGTKSLGIESADQTAD